MYQFLDQADMTSYLLLEFGGTSFHFSLKFEELVEYLTRAIGREQVKVLGKQEQMLKQE